MRNPGLKQRKYYNEVPHNQFGPVPSSHSKTLLSPTSSVETFSTYNKPRVNYVLTTMSLCLIPTAVGKFHTMWNKFLLTPKFTCDFSVNQVLEIFVSNHIHLPVPHFQVGILIFFVP